MAATANWSQPTQKWLELSCIADEPSSGDFFTTYFQVLTDDDHDGLRWFKETTVQDLPQTYPKRLIGDERKVSRGRLLLGPLPWDAGAAQELAVAEARRELQGYVVRRLLFFRLSAAGQADVKAEGRRQVESDRMLNRRSGTNNLGWSKWIILLLLCKSRPIVKLCIICCWVRVYPPGPAAEQFRPSEILDSKLPEMQQKKKKKNSWSSSVSLDIHRKVGLNLLPAAAAAEDEVIEDFSKFSTSFHAG